MLHLFLIIIYSIIRGKEKQHFVVYTMISKNKFRDNISLRVIPSDQMLKMGRRVYLSTAAISYGITVVMGIITIFSDIADVPNWYSNGFVYGQCINVNIYIFILSCVTELLCPSAITFSVSILLMQAEKKKYISKVILCILLILIFIFWFVQFFSYTSLMLGIISGILSICIVVSFFYCWRIYYHPFDAREPLKMEKSDCSPVT